MSKLKKTSVGAINITIQPHSPDLYVSLFKSANFLKRAIQIRGDSYGILSGAGSLQSNQSDPFTVSGDVFRFTNIDKNSNWFNTLTFDFADEDDLDRVRLPENLKPNSSRFTYLFDANKHQLFYEAYFDGKNFRPNSAVKFFERLLNQPELNEDFGRVEVTHIPMADQLEVAFALPYKRRIEIITTVPNPDDLEGAEREVMRRMNEQNIGEQRQEYSAAPGKSIEMSEDLKTFARVSARNGNVKIKGRDADDRPKEISTDRHPFVLSDYFDPAIESAFSALKRVSDQMKKEIERLFHQ